MHMADALVSPTVGVTDDNCYSRSYSLFNKKDKN